VIRFRVDIEIDDIPSASMVVAERTEDPLVDVEGVVAFMV
jgi:hypothetical protein